MAVLVSLGYPRSAAATLLLAKVETLLTAQPNPTREVAAKMRWAEGAAPAPAKEAGPTKAIPAAISALPTTDIRVSSVVDLIQSQS